MITGLDSAKTYDLYIASAILISSNQCSRGEWSTTNTTSTVGSQAVDNRENENGSTWVRGNNYVLFEDVVPDGSGNITVNGFAITEQPTYDIRLPLNGFQLVESVATASAPGPAPTVPLAKPRSRTTTTMAWKTASNTSWAKPVPRSPPCPAWMQPTRSPGR